MASEPVRIERYLHAADTTSTLAAVRVAGSARGGPRRGDRRARHRPARGARARPADRRRQRRHAAAPAARVARRPGGPLVHARRRRVDPPPAGRPDRRAAAQRWARELQAREGRFPPLHVRRGARLRAISYELAVASAQVKSCVLLAALAADGATTVGEPTRSRDHTERMLLAAGVSDPPQRPARHRRQRRRAAARTRERARRPELGRLPRSPPACSCRARAC